VHAVTRASWRDPSSARERLLVGCLAVLALLSLPASLALELHHADHHGVWIAGEPDRVQIGDSDPGASNELGCTLCLATGNAGSASLGRTAEVAAHAPSTDLRGCTLDSLLPQCVDLALAGPRAPPQA
jgi:hypothetical protein